jgi:peptide/nickel transport system ATP-binding protein
MRQRVVIAIAVALEPKFIIMDEPTTALDVIVQKSILEQIMELRDRLGFSILFISHDFNLVQEISNRVGVMYAGRLVEMSKSASDLALTPRHPYTQGLIRAIPKLTSDDEDIQGIPGSPPSASNRPSGCAFHPRCPYAKPICRTVEPGMTTVAGNLIECHLSEDELRSMTYAER